MTSNQIAKQQADAATENAAANKSNARTNALNYKENVRHNTKSEALKGGEVVVKGIDTIGRLIRPSGKNFLNDVNWYVASDQLLRDTCARSFNSALGVGYAKGIHMIPNQNIPGVMIIHWSPVIPVGSAGDALNKAAYALYAYIRYANAGSRNYTAADLMEYIMAMDSIYCLYAQCCKYYGLSRKYSATNRYLPNGLTRSDIFLETIHNNPAEFRSRLNLCAKYINSWYVPTKLSLFERHMFLSSQIYADADSQFAQLYNFELEGFWQFNETSPKDAPIPAAGSLQYIEIYKSTSKGAFGVLEQLENAIDRIMRIEDIGIISGDILKVYGADVYKVSEIPEEYDVPILYHTEMLTQIENMNIMGPLAEKPHIVQTTIAKGGVSDFDLQWFNEGTTETAAAANDFKRYKANPIVKIPVNNVGGKAQKWSQEGIYRDMHDLYVNLDDKHLTPGDVMVATRLKAQIYDAGGMLVQTQDEAGYAPYLWFPIINCPTEIVNGVDIVYYDINLHNIQRAFVHSSIVHIDAMDQTGATYSDDMVGFRYLASFDWCPQLLLKVTIMSNTTSDWTIPVASSQDLKRISALTEKDFSNMNNVAFTKEIGLADADARADRAKRY